MGNIKTMRVKIFVILVMLIGVMSFGFAQEPLNQTDSHGMKQGHWIGRYPDGKIKYEGTFIDGEPVGQMTRYYPNGQLQARMHYVPGSDSIIAEIFNDEGKRTAKGVFLGKKKSGTWTYFDGDRVVSCEHYQDGLHVGTDTIFFKNGTPARTSEWKTGRMDGVMRELYPNGKTKFAMHYADGKRAGLTMAYYENDTLEIEGNYINNLRTGNWNFYNQDGSLKYTLKYQSGVLMNGDVLNKAQQKEFDEMEKNREVLKDPEKYRYDPSGYMNPGP